MQQAGRASLSFDGVGGRSWGPNGSFRARLIMDSDRYRLLDRKQSYFDCQQHAYKRYDFDGRSCQQGSSGAMQPLLTADKAPYYIPLRARQPSSPYRT